MKDGHYIGTAIFGNTEIEIRGYNGQQQYAYIGDHDITEMANELNLWQKIDDELCEQTYR